MKLFQTFGDNLLGSAKNLVCGSLLLVTTIQSLLISTAFSQEIRQPLPNGSSNAALHYQRAILFLADVDIKSRKLLEDPIWKIVTPQMTDEQENAITQLLYGGRHAIRAGMIGSQQNVADFGVDLRAYGAALLLPHVGPLQDLAKLVALYGMQQQGQENWTDAAETFLSVIRMGRHLTEQLTLGESVKGIRILETGYYCLVTWAAHCPDRDLIAATRQSLLAASADSVLPLAAISNEAAIVDLRLTQLQAAYPDGNWPEILLAATNAPLPTEGVTDWREFAKSEVIKRGVPASVFESNEEFDKYIEKMRDINRKFYARTLAALSLPPEQAIAEGQKVYAEFSDQLLRLGDPDTLSPAQIATFYATHEATSRLLDVALAVCAQREGDLYPQDLSGLAATFSGQLPVSPIGQKPVEYKVADDRKGFRILFAAAKVGDVEIPEVAFAYNFGSVER